jgi:hypothetical protein
MAHNAGYIRISRWGWLLAGLAIPMFSVWAVEKLGAVFDGDNLYPLAPPSFHFLAGKPLQRLKGGDTVHYASRLTLSGDEGRTIIRQSPSQFIVSYSLWEEKFQVTILGSPPRTQPGLSQAAAESMCLDSIAISASGLAPDRPFWLKFELKTVREKDISALLGDSQLSLSAPLIDFFSRKTGANDEYSTFSTDRLRLSDLPRLSSRRAPF